MIALLENADAMFLAAVVPVLIAQLFSIRQGRKTSHAALEAAQQLKSNGGSSMYDLAQRMERKLDRLHQRHDELAERIYLIEDHVTLPRKRPKP